MTRFDSVYEAFLTVVQARPDAPAIIFPEDSCSYDRLHRIVLGFAERMAGLGVGPAATITLQSADPMAVLGIVLAASRLGASFVQHAEGLQLPGELVLTHRFHTPEPRQTPAASSVPIDAEWSPTSAAAALPAAEADGDRPFLYVFTTGTTGLPKFLAWSQRMVCARSAAVADDFVAGTTRFASLLPCHTRPFIARGLAALLNGATVVAGRNADFWQAAGVTMVSGSVAQMTGFLAERTLVPRIAVAEVIGSRLSMANAALILGSFEVVEDVFGASETSKAFSNVITRAPDGSLLTRGRKRDSEIEIVDTEGNALPAGAAGIVRIRNPYLATAYVGDPAATAEAFRDGWFYSGDVASWGEAGELKVMPREDNVLNIGGIKVNALVVDGILRSVNGIVDAACFKSPKDGGPDELFAFVVFREGGNRLQLVELARQACRDRLAPALVPRVIQGVSGIPRTAEGVPDRKMLGEFIRDLDRRRLRPEPIEE